MEGRNLLTARLLYVPPLVHSTRLGYTDKLAPKASKSQEMNGISHIQLDIGKGTRGYERE